MRFAERLRGGGDAGGGSSSDDADWSSFGAACWPPLGVTRIAVGREATCRFAGFGAGAGGGS